MKIFHIKQSKLTGLALMVLKAGTTNTITTNNVNVSDPKSLMTSTALETSTTADKQNFLFWVFLWWKHDRSPPTFREDGQVVPLKISCEKQPGRFILVNEETDRERTSRLQSYETQYRWIRGWEVALWRLFRVIMSYPCMRAQEIERIH